MRAESAAPQVSEHLQREKLPSCTSTSTQAIRAWSSGTVSCPSLPASLALIITWGVDARPAPI